MREIVLQTKKLSKRYKNFTALDSVDMTVYRGDIYGFIGRNGAGKTTIMKIITGLAEASGGEFEIFSKKGAEASAEKRRMGCLIENPSFFGNLTAYQNLKYYAIQKGIVDMGQIDNALSLVQLSDVKDKKFRKFSLGMKQRLGIALALLDNPDLIILDEPINGLDPLGISELRNTFKRLNQEFGITIIISSHILSELYLVANRFFFIEKGRMLKEITKEELDLECMRCLVVKTDNTRHCATILEEMGITNYKVINTGELRIYGEPIKPETLNKTLINHSINISGIFESGISLEDYFKSLIGGEAQV
ncbi:MAG: ATP-binding cassette domain-containing protein [Lachnospiraceae bacterium]|nr:ATP-binding cassette domain-containing protein [Lachnospiraceae bacterium]